MFPTPPSTSKAGQTLQESVMKRRVEPNHLPADAPDKPFFMYWALGASHGPHQVPKEWADKYQRHHRQDDDQIFEEVTNCLHPANGK
jgi:arylsulfatase A-like enzyme